MGPGSTSVRPGSPYKRSWQAQVRALLCLFVEPLPNAVWLVVCRGLDAAVTELRQRELSEHAIGVEWLERDCVSIDPCEQKSSNEDPYFGNRLPALAGVWLSGNSSALRLGLTAGRVQDAEAGVRAENYGSFEFARVPEGLRVQACAPDFDRWRREGVLACNEKTLVTITADAGARACPGAKSFSLLDCVKPLQFDAGSQTLLRRPPGEKMHFGSLTRGEACWPWPADDLAARLCVDAAEYSMQVPVAAALGSTSLLKYEFLEGYACRRVSEVPGEGDGKVLSRAVAPNRVVTCPSVAHGSPVRVDPVTCGIECDSGFQLREGQCVSHCLGLHTTCERGWAAELGCVQGAQTLYNCTQCQPRAGFGAAAFDPNNAFECQYTACAAGTRSVGRDCEPCGVNTFSNASEAVACEACDTLVTGLYQRESGGTACHSCLWNASVSPDACAPGSELAQSFERVTALFDLYSAHNANLSDYVTGFCDQGRRGY